MSLLHTKLVVKGSEIVTVMSSITSHLQHIFRVFLLFRLAMGTVYVSQAARQVMEQFGKQPAIQVDTPQSSSFHLTKADIVVPNAAQVVQTSSTNNMTKRKWSKEQDKNTNYNYVGKESILSKNDAHVRKRKGVQHGNRWKEKVMAFTADYRSPKSHPPRHN